MLISALVIMLMLPMSPRAKQKGVKGGKGIKRGYLTFFKVLEILEHI